jgi:hypothetical protein
MWMKLQPSRHHVAIAGQVSDAETGQVIAGARVELTQVPESFQKRLALQALQHGDRWATLSRRPDRTDTALDGFFYFTDLPASSYGLTIALAPAGTRYGTAQATVTVSSPGTRLQPIAIALPPTSLKGQIQNARGEPIEMATIRLEGSSEQTLSADQGRYLLTALEASPVERTVTAIAQGYATQSQTIQLKSGSAHTLDFVLQR